MGESIELVDIGNFCEDCVIGFLGGLVIALAWSHECMYALDGDCHQQRSWNLKHFQVSSALGIFPKEYRSRVFSGEDPQH